MDQENTTIARSSSPVVVVVRLVQYLRTRQVRVTIGAREKPKWLTNRPSEKLYSFEILIQPPKLAVAGRS